MGFWDDEFKKLGRLSDEVGPSNKQLLSGKFIEKGLRGGFRLGFKSARAKAPDGRTPVYFHQSYVSDRRFTPPAPRSDRIWVYPRHNEVGKVRELGGRRDRAARCWHVPAGTDVPANWTRPDRARPAGAHGLGAARSGPKGEKGHLVPTAADTAVAWQDYVEGEEGGTEKLLADAEGSISFGNIGSEREDRRQFWRRVAEIEGPERRIQTRTTIALWADQTPAEHREVATRFCKIFEDRNLPYWAVVHVPDVKSGTDPSNVHLHIAWHDRALAAPRSTARSLDGDRVEFGAAAADLQPMTRSVKRQGGSGPESMVAEAQTGGGIAGSIFSQKKDREARGPAWVAALRDRYCDIAQDIQRRHAAAHGMTPTTLYVPGRYQDLGIDKLPGEHLGPQRTALERAGIATAAGRRNAQREAAWRLTEILRDAEARAEKREGEAIALAGTLQRFRRRAGSLPGAVPQSFQPVRERTVGRPTADPSPMPVPARDLASLLGRWAEAAGLFVETAGFFDEAVTGQRKADLVGELTGWRGPLDEAARLVAVPEASAVRPRPQPRRAAPVRPQPRFTRPKSPSPVAADTSATSVIASAGEPASGFLGPERPGDLIQLERDVERRRRELNDLTVAVEEHLRGLEAAAEAARRGDRWKRLAGEDLVSVPLAEPSRLLPAEADRLARRLARSGLGNDGRLAQAMLALAMPAVDAASIGTGGPISTAVSRSPSSDRAPERGAAGAPSSAGAGLPGSAAVREAELLLGIDEMMRRRRDNVAWKRLDFADQVELVREVLALAALAAERGVAQGDRLARQRADRREERREIEAWFVARPQTWVEARRVGLPVDEWRAVAERRRRALEATVDARTPRRGLEL